MAHANRGETWIGLLSLASKEPNPTLDGATNAYSNLVAHAADAGDFARAAQDENEKAYHLGQHELITPLIKAYASDQAFKVCETAIQTFGGVGYTREF